MSTTRLDRTTFRTSRMLDFLSRKELTAQTGHAEDDWPLVVLKELVDNALDACEDANLPPEITITVNESGITVSDNGPGIPAETIEGVLDFSVRVSSREAYVAPDRGAQGNALMTIVAMPFVLDGEWGKVEISARGVRHHITLAVDRIRQEPIVGHEPESIGERAGTEVRVFWPLDRTSSLVEISARFLQLADDYTFLNPHLTMRVSCFDERLEVAATDPGWKKWRPSDPTSPHWYEDDHIERLIAAYITDDADRGRERTVREFVSEFRGLSGSAKQKLVLEATGLARTNLSQLVNAEGLDKARLRLLLAAMQEHSKPVKPQALGLIGREHLLTQLGRHGYMPGSADLGRAFKYQKVDGIEHGVPKVAELAFGYCQGLQRRRIVTGVNWSPGILNPFRALGRYGQSLDGVLADLYAGSEEPVLFVLHMACPRVEYTDRGKSAVVI